MRLPTWFLYARTFNRSFGFVILCIVTFTTGCVNRSGDPQPVPENVRRAVSILGDDTSVSGGIRVSTIYRSFLSRIEKEIASDGSAIGRQNRIILNRIGLDPSVDEISVFFAFKKSGPQSIPGLLLFAPVPENSLDSLAANWDHFQLLDSTSAIRRQIARELPIYELSSEEESLYLALPEEQTLSLSSSAEYLNQMLDRAFLETPDLRVDQIRLIDLVGAADVWLVTKNIPGLLEALSVDQIPDEIGRIVMAIANMAGAAELRNESLKISLYFEPRTRVQAQDLSDLIRGAIALVKLNLEDSAQLVEILEQIDVSEYDEFSRVQLKMSETDLINLIQSVPR